MSEADWREAVDEGFERITVVVHGIGLPPTEEQRTSLRCWSTGEGENGRETLVTTRRRNVPVHFKSPDGLNRTLKLKKKLSVEQRSFPQATKPAFNMNEREILLANANAAHWQRAPAGMEPFDASAYVNQLKPRALSLLFLCWAVSLLLTAASKFAQGQPLASQLLFGVGGSVAILGCCLLRFAKGWVHTGGHVCVVVWLCDCVIV